MHGPPLRKTTMKGRKYRMKKSTLWQRILCTVMALALLLPSAVVPAEAAVSKTDAYIAYYDFLLRSLDRIDQRIEDQDFYKTDFFYISGASKGLSTLDKILAVYLLDVTNDGVEDLIVKWKIRSYGKNGEDTDEWVCVYTYLNGKLQKIGQGCDFVDSNGGTYEPEGYIGYILSSEDSPYISNDCVYLCKGSNGKYYLADEEPTAGMDGSFSFFAFNGSKMARVDSFGIQFIPDWRVGSIRSDYGRFIYTYGGSSEPRTQSQFEARMRKYTAKGITKLVNNDYHTALNKLEKAVGASFKPSAWSAETVNAAIEKGYVPWELRKLYRQPITRGEFCALAAAFYEKYTGTTIGATAEFTDTQDLSIRKMASLGIVYGTGQGRFHPNGTLTREAAAVILMRMAAQLGYQPIDGIPTFTDSDKIGGYAAAGVAQASNAGIMNGLKDGSFNPKGSYTREQSIVTMMRMENLSPEVSALELSETQVEMFAGGTHALKLSGRNGEKPVLDNVLAGSVVWQSSDPSVVSVDGQGKLQGLRSGSTTITASAGSARASCRVRVIQINGEFYADLPATVTLDLKDMVTKEVIPDGVTLKIIGIERRYPDNNTLTNQYYIMATVLSCAQGSYIVEGMPLLLRSIDGAEESVTARCSGSCYAANAPGIKNSSYGPISESGGQGYIKNSDGTAPGYGIEFRINISGTFALREREASRPFIFDFTPCLR